MSKVSTIKPKSLEDLIKYCKYGVIPRHYANHYLLNYTLLPAIEHEGEDTVSAIWAFYNQGLIVETLLDELEVKVRE